MNTNHLSPIHFIVLPSIFIPLSMRSSRRTCWTNREKLGRNVERSSDGGYHACCELHLWMMNCKPLNYQLNAITRDLSSKGVGLVSTSPIAREFVLLTFRTLPRQLLRCLGQSHLLQ